MSEDDRAKLFEEYTQRTADAAREVYGVLFRDTRDWSLGARKAFELMCTYALLDVGASLARRNGWTEDEFRRMAGLRFMLRKFEP